MTQQAPGSAQSGCPHKAMGTVSCAWRGFPRPMGVPFIRLRLTWAALAWASCASVWMPSGWRCGSGANLCIAHGSGASGMKTPRHPIPVGRRQ